MRIPLTRGIPEKQIADAVSSVLCIPNVRRGTAYISPDFIVKATVQHRIDKRAKRATVLVTVGKPNFVDRRFIRLCRKAGMVFPLKQIQLQFWPKKR